MRKLEGCWWGDGSTCASSPRSRARRMSSTTPHDRQVLVPRPDRANAHAEGIIRLHAQDQDVNMTQSRTTSRSGLTALLVSAEDTTASGIVSMTNALADVLPRAGPARRPASFSGPTFPPNEKTLVRRRVAAQPRVHDHRAIGADDEDAPRRIPIAALELFTGPGTHFQLVLGMLGSSLRLQAPALRERAADRRTNGYTRRYQRSFKCPHAGSVKVCPSTWPTSTPT